MKKNTSQKRNLRKSRIHKKIRITSNRPRLLVCRSLKNISAQIIDQDNSILASASSLKLPEAKRSPKTSAATEVGKVLAQEALKKNVKKVVFDRGRYKYHGRIKALAEAARKTGLDF